MGLVLGNFPGLSVSPTVAALTFTIAVALGIGAGLVPAAGAYRSRITDMLRQA
jgi:ABC-type antimicrobial peptide transport system permease subunit